MASDGPQLESMATSVDDLCRRVTALGDSYEHDQRLDISAPLRDAERALSTAARRLEAAARALR